MKADKIIELVSQHADSSVISSILRRLVHDMNGSVAAIAMDIQVLERRRQRLSSGIGHLIGEAAELVESMSSVIENIKDATEDLRLYLRALDGAKPPAEGS